MPDHVRLHRDGQVAVITIARPDRRNAMDGPMWTALGELVRSTYAEPPRALIITGEGEHFCAGMDLSVDNPLLRRLGPAASMGDKDGVRAIIEELKASVGSLADAPFPTIAAIEGACVGGGLEIALACDLRVGSESSFFGMPETRVGLAPDVGGIVRLSHLVGRSRATDLILTGRRLDAKSARRWGLTNRRTVAGAALPTAQHMAAEIRRGAPQTTAAVLRALRDVEGATVADGLEIETRAGIDTVLLGEWKEGAAAFMQKREPQWK